MENFDSLVYLLDNFNTMRFSKHNKETLRQLIRSEYPYCISNLNNNMYKIQNRDYKILGTIKMDLSDVCNFKNNITIIHDGDRKKLSNDLNYFYMYNDGCQPWRDKKLFEKYIDSLDFLNIFVID